ncbi:MAG: DUF3631 domain-containing protein [Candidatus Competibacteraceae bacterium]|nr:DUF3631 domain-containing protein [Candidatus Competibacteraceae bacterium]
MKPETELTELDRRAALLDPAAEEQDNAEPIDEDALLAELASLPALDYERRRKPAAELLEIRPAILDKLVDAVRKAQAVNDEPQTLSIEDPEPWPDPVDGADLLAAISETLGRYVALPEGAADAVALWVLHSYCLDAVFVSPFLTLSSPEKRCGKTTLLSLVKELSRRSLMASNITPAALFRSIEKFRPSLMIDEADCFIRDNDELRGVLNSGHTRTSAFVVRVMGDKHEPAQFSTWAAKCIALIGRLPDTLADRSIVIPMRRRLPGETVAKLRLDKLDGLKPLARQCLRWAHDHSAQVSTCDPELPPGINDRAADNWRPLAQIADSIGGDWRARLIASIRCLAETDSDDDSIGAELLRDVKAIFESKSVDRIFTADLLEALCNDDEAPWSTWNRGKPITARQLANRFKDFGIVTKQPVRIGSLVAKGYRLNQFDDAFSRYLPDSPLSMGYRVTRLEPKGIPENPMGYTKKNVTHRKTSKAAQDKGCNPVTHRNPQNGDISV